MRAPFQVCCTKVTKLFVDICSEITDKSCLKTRKVLNSYPLPRLIIERPRYVDCPGHVLDGEGAAEVAAGDLVTDAGG